MIRDPRIARVAAELARREAAEHDARMAQLRAAAPVRQPVSGRVAILFALAFGLLAIGALCDAILNGWAVWVRS